VKFRQCKDIDAPGVEQVQVNLSDHSRQNIKSNTPLGTDDVCLFNSAVTCHIIVIVSMGILMT
jgi:hypothetical protein